jgi:hypothetical protein
MYTIEEIENVKYDKRFPEAFFYNYVETLVTNLSDEETHDFIAKCNRYETLRKKQFSFLLDCQREMNMDLTDELRTVFDKIRIWSYLEFYTNFRLNK